MSKRKAESKKAIKNMEEIWRQLPHESAQAYELFLEFLAGDTRVLREFHRNKGRDESDQYQKDFLWSERAKAYDRMLNEETANTLMIMEIRQRISDYEKYNKLESDTINIINDLLGDIDIINSKQSYSLNQATSSLKVFNEIKRLLSEQPTEITQSNTTINGDINSNVSISDDELFDGIKQIEKELNNEKD